VVTLPPVTPFTCQVTAVELVPVTVCVKVCFPNVPKVTAAGPTVTVTFWLLTVPLGNPLQAASTETITMLNGKIGKRRIGPPVVRCVFQASTDQFAAEAAAFCALPKRLPVQPYRRAQSLSAAIRICVAGLRAFYGLASCKKMAIREPFKPHLVQIPPVRAGTNLNDQRNRKLVHPFHLFPDEFFEFAFFFRWGFEQQFVVHLQNHLRFEFFRCETPVDADHCQLDEVRRCPLQRRI